jgi:hypothetical protein
MWADPDHSLVGRSVIPEAQILARQATLGIRLLVLAILAGLCFASGGRGRPLDLALGYALACAATLLISPIAWGHYYMIELPVLVVLPLWLAEKRRSLAALPLVAVPVLLAWTHYLFLKYVGWAGLLGFGTTAWFLATCTLIGFAWTENVPARAVSKNRPRLRKNRNDEPRSVFS